MRRTPLLLVNALLSLSACASRVPATDESVNASTPSSSRAGARGGPASDELVTLRFPDDYRGPGAHDFHELHDQARATASVMPPELRFALGPLETRPDRVVLQGELINATATAYEIVVNGDVFSLVLDPNEAVRPRPYDGPPRPPPVPPPPMLLEVPAHSRIQIRAEVYLPDLLYTGAPEVRLRWEFAAWNLPRPSGELTATLPRR